MSKRLNPILLDDIPNRLPGGGGLKQQIRGLETVQKVCTRAQIKAFKVHPVTWLAYIKEMCLRPCPSSAVNSRRQGTGCHGEEQLKEQNINNNKQQTAAGVGVCAGSLKSTVQTAGDRATAETSWKHPGNDD